MILTDRIRPRAQCRHVNVSSNARVQERFHHRPSSIDMHALERRAALEVFANDADEVNRRDRVRQTFGQRINGIQIAPNDADVIGHALLEIAGSHEAQLTPNPRARSRVSDAPADPTKSTVPPLTKTRGKGLVSIAGDHSRWG